MRVLLTNFYDMTYYLILIFVFISWIFIQILIKFFWYKKDNSVLTRNYSFYFLRLTPVTHVFLEFIWTVLPMVIFFFVFIPILKLLRISGFNDYYSFEDSAFENNKRINAIVRNFVLDLEDKFFSVILELDDKSMMTFSNLSFKSLDFNQITAIKVIGNQWYWMYEQFYDLTDNWNFYHYTYGLLDFTDEGLISQVETEYSDEVLFAYLNDVEDYWVQLNCVYEVDGYNEVPDSEWNSFIKSNYSTVWTDSLRLLSTDYYISLPKNVLISFFLTSYDVIHCWAIPSAAVKVDCCPGRIASVKLFLCTEGFYYGQCSELCGFLHGFMPICLKVY